MPIADLLIIVAIVFSISVGIFRGFVKEAISIVTLLLAIWAAMNFGAHAGQLTGRWVDSGDLQVWIGRVLVFVVVLTAGGLVGWGFSRLVRLSALSGTDRALGAMFGFCRGALLLGLFIIGGQMANFDRNNWWQTSLLIPYGSVVAERLRAMTPDAIDKSLQLLQPMPLPDDEVQ